MAQLAGILDVIVIGMALNFIDKLPDERTPRADDMSGEREVSDK